MYLKFFDEVDFTFKVSDVIKHSNQILPSKFILFQLIKLDRLSLILNIVQT